MLDSTMYSCQNYHIQNDKLYENQWKRIDKVGGKREKFLFIFCQTHTDEFYQKRERIENSTKKKIEVEGNAKVLHKIYLVIKMKFQCC